MRNNAIIDPIGLVTVRREIQFISDHPVAIIHLRVPLNVCHANLSVKFYTQSSLNNRLITI